MQTGWLDDGGRRYFLEGNGAMAKAGPARTGSGTIWTAQELFPGAGSMTMEPGITAARMA